VEAKPTLPTIKETSVASKKAAAAKVTREDPAMNVQLIIPADNDLVVGGVDYEEHGDGPTVVLVPGSCSTGAAWRPVVAELGGSYRCITTSLLGYGGTSERRAVETADMADEAEIVEEVVRRATGPVHLVGHSFGGTTALAVALRNRMPLLSLTVMEPPIPELLRHLGEPLHYGAFRDMTHGYFKAFDMGVDRAIETMIDFYGGVGTFDSWPARVRNYAVATTPVNLLDWACAYSFYVTRSCLSKVELPTLVIKGGQSHPAMQRLNELLGECLPNANVETIEGAAHFMISTHAPQVARAIHRHVRHQECARSL
jgi:pimeloyl-ACP methyl ester carboxylesterase